jgi:hypothetical protein
MNLTPLATYMYLPWCSYTCVCLHAYIVNIIVTEEAPDSTLPLFTLVQLLHYLNVGFIIMAEWGWFV